ncbi:M12 family metallo-peptidase [Streptomyces sp. NPDC002623]
MPSSPSRPSLRRILTSLTAALVAVLALLAASTTPAHAATAPVYSGKGWKAGTTAFGIYSISPDPYTIVFANAAARTRLTPYLKGPVSQFTAITGIKVTISTTLDTTKPTACPTRHRIVVHYTYRPTGQSGMSQARPCYEIPDRSAWGGHVLIDTEYWTVASWFSTNATVNDGYRKDTVTHEIGHIFGLDHANTDVNKNGKVENKECVKNASGVKPIMCSTNRGAVPATAAGKYTTEFDAVGLKQMAANWILRKV